MTDLLGWGLGEPLQAVVKAFTGLGQAAACCDVTDGQVVGAAVDLVLTAGGLSQRAAGPGEAVAKVLPHAAAGAPCTTITYTECHVHVRRHQKSLRQAYTHHLYASSC